MEKIKVKAYGVINFTKRQYIITQVIVFVILIACVILSFIFDFSEYKNIVISNLGLVFIVVIVLEICETLVMLRKFKTKERQKFGRQ